jgi:glutamate/tyrosine decarboxylase-like PLP-dependent enzyme
MANFAGLALAREWIARQFGKSIAQDGLHAVPPISVLSGEAHSSIFKVLALLGLGRNSLRAVPTLPGHREAVDVEALRQALEQLGDPPCIVVANAGTVNRHSAPPYPEFAYRATKCAPSKANKV